MRAVRSGLVPGLIAHGALLIGVARTAGLGRRGWWVSAVSGLAVNVAVARGLHAGGAVRPTPADLTTLARAMMGCAVAGLVADRTRTSAGPVMVSLAAGALALDAVDGRVARYTHTATSFGARFDGEVDALLILTLSVQVARSFGPWVLGAGLARYGFAAAGCVWPWLRRPLPPRYWRKVAAATEGVTLTSALVPGLPRRVATAGLAAGSALIAESFGRDLWWLWRRRHAPAA